MGESLLKSIELINAIIASAVQQKTVSLPLDIDEYDALFDDLCRGNSKIIKRHFK